MKNKKSMTYTGSLNVRYFGAKGDGRSDDTLAIQAALDAASEAVMTRQDTEKISYPNGIPSRAGYHCHSTGPEVFFPHGHYTITAHLLTRKTLALRGEGHPWIEQKNKKQDIIYGDNSIRQTFRCLSFHGGRTHLNIGNNNEDNGLLLIEDCKFYESAATAIHVRDHSYSTMLMVLRCQIVGCEQGVVTSADFNHIREGWLTGGCSGDGAMLVNSANGEMTVSNLCCVPMVNGRDQRWIDNHGALACRSVRFGGEEAGFTPVVNFARHVPQICGSREPYIILDGCAVCALGNAKRRCAVYCEEIPNLIDIHGCTLTGVPPVMVSEQISPESYFIAKPGMLSFRFEANFGEFSNNIPSVFKRPKLNTPNVTDGFSPAESRAALAHAKKDWAAKRKTAEKTGQLSFQGHRQKTGREEYMELAPSCCKWDLEDYMDGTTQKNSCYYALAEVPGGILVMRNARGTWVNAENNWAHIIVRNVTIELDSFPYLSWDVIKTGSPATVFVKAIHKETGRTIPIETSEVGTAGYRAYNLKKMLGAGKKQTFDIKLYYMAREWTGGIRVNPHLAKRGDYIIIPFLRAEKD
ncbi:MAG: hypothetical protein JW957_01840 [Candidatus Omnitrophica bacterium]|nr:hypothetical protein [Candidatus Omnitrophota bacterium]